MKPYLLIATAMILASTAFSQCILTYKDNALLPGDVILSKEVQFADPGSSGLNQIWDFSKIGIKGAGNSSSMLSGTTVNPDGISEYNVLLTEGGREYYMYNTSAGLTEKGYNSKRFTMAYTDPMRKMMYPFAFGESFTDTYLGSTMYNGTEKIDISGEYAVTADASGTLILPDRTLTNTLRVKAVKAGLELNPCNSSLVSILKYSWYAPGYRYPVLVISTTEFTTTGQEPVITKSAVIHVQQAVNTETLTPVTELQLPAADDNAVSVYPNPFNDIFNFHYFLGKPMPVRIALYDMAGKCTKVIRQTEMQAEGVHTGKISAVDMNLTPGMYYLKFTFENKMIVKKVVKL